MLLKAGLALALATLSLQSLACSPAIEPPLPKAPSGESVQVYTDEEAVFVAEVRGSFRQPWRVGLFLRVTDALTSSVTAGEIVELEFMGCDYVCGESWCSAQDVKVEEFKPGSRVMIMVRVPERPLRLHIEELGKRFRVLAQPAS